MASIILTGIRLPVLAFGPTLPPPVAAINQPRLLQPPIQYIVMRHLSIVKRKKRTTGVRTLEVPCGTGPFNAAEEVDPAASQPARLPPHVNVTGAPILTLSTDLQHATTSVLMTAPAVTQFLPADTTNPVTSVLSTLARNTTSSCAGCLHAHPLRCSTSSLQKTSMFVSSVEWISVVKMPWSGTCEILLK
jgi:hypothetical protein